MIKTQITIPVANKIINDENKVTFYKNKNKPYVIDKEFCFNIDREMELKNLYYDSHMNNITDKDNLWVNSDINKSIVKFKWDNRSKIFAFDFSFIDKEVIKEINFKFNNNETFKANLKLEPMNSMYCQAFYSTDFNQGKFNIDNINTIQINLLGKKITKQINIVVGKYKNIKNDFLIRNKSTLKLNFQNELVIKGENINKMYSSLKINNIEIEHGKWFQKLLQLSNESIDVFDRNIIDAKVIDNLPISSNSVGSFNIVPIQKENNIWLTIQQDTYYDPIKKEVIKGLNKNSNPGFILPFEFKGTFSPSLSIMINNCLFNLKWEQLIEKAYFKDSTSIYKIILNTSTESNDDSNWTKITSDLMIESKEYEFLNFNEFEEWLKNKNNE